MRLDARKKKIDQNGNYVGKKKTQKNVQGAVDGRWGDPTCWPCENPWYEGLSEEDKQHYDQEWYENMLWESGHWGDDWDENAWYGAPDQTQWNQTQWTPGGVWGSSSPASPQVDNSTWNLYDGGGDGQDRQAQADDG